MGRDCLSLKQPFGEYYALNKADNDDDDDTGICKAANEEHARHLPIMNGIKEDIKSIGVLINGSPAYQEAFSNLSKRLKSLLVSRSTLFMFIANYTHTRIRTYTHSYTSINIQMYVTYSYRDVCNRIMYLYAIQITYVHIYSSSYILDIYVKN